jgi:methylmalonyl-CoA mutase N-terminal domain/subunit
MTRTAIQLPLPGFEQARGEWRSQYSRQMGEEKPVRNRSGVEIQPLYSASDWSGDRYLEDLGFPGQFPFTRGIYPSMHRGRTWTQRQLIGLGTPEDYNKRVRRIIDAGATAISLLPCCSGFRGIDCDEVDPLLLGTCGTVINTTDHMDGALDDVPIGEISTAMNDPSPFTLLAFTLGVARRRGVDWRSVTGTSNQSDYISHFIANHQFYRLSLPGSRRVLLDHIEFCRRHVPNWNPVSVVGQHMQQAGATPAETMGLRFRPLFNMPKTALHVAWMWMTSCVASRFLRHLDLAFRGGRKVPGRSPHLGEDRARPAGRKGSCVLEVQIPWPDIGCRPHAATAPQQHRSGLHPGNGGILSGLQSLHTDAYDEAIACPSEETARVAVATQNILRDEAGLCDVIDPLGGSYYVERLTDQMEAEIEGVIARIDAAGGMYKAAEAGLVQTMIGESALAFQEQVDSAERKIVGVNCYQIEEDPTVPPAERPDPEAMLRHVERFKAFKRERSQQQVVRALDALARAANSKTKCVREGGGGYRGGRHAWRS